LKFNRANQLGKRQAIELFWGQKRKQQVSKSGRELAHDDLNNNFRPFLRLFAEFQERN